MMEYSVQAIEGRLSLLVNNKKAEQSEQPKLVKTVVDERESERKTVEKSISEL